MVASGGRVRAPRRAARRRTAEDVLVMKAVANDEDTLRYWHDALAIVAQAELDLDYPVRRSRQHGARRVLRLLLYAQSNDLVAGGGHNGGCFDSNFQGNGTPDRRGVSYPITWVPEVREPMSAEPDDIPRR